MFCIECGSKLEKDQKFCAECGLNVESILVEENKDIQKVINEELVDKEEKVNEKLSLTKETKSTNHSDTKIKNQKLIYVFLNMMIFGAIAAFFFIGYENQFVSSPCSKSRSDEISLDCYMHMEPIYKENKVRWFKVFNWARKNNIKEVVEFDKAVERGDERSYERLIPIIIEKYKDR